MLILSVFIGLLAGLAAVLLKNTTHWVQQWVRSDFFGQFFNLYYFAFPIVGILLTVLLRGLFKEPIGEGIPSTLFAISRRRALIKPFRMYASLITSSITVGFGGSVGLEGPTVSTGAALGSNIARVMRLNFKQRILLISCASAGAISAIFNAPIAAIIFTIEIFSLDLTLASLIPLLLASVSGAVMSIFMQGNHYLFHFKNLEAFSVGQLPWYILLGVLTALASVYFQRVYQFFDRRFTRMKGRWRKWALGSTALGLSIWLVPPLYGEGYETINALLNGEPEKIIGYSFFRDFAWDNQYLILVLLLGLVFLKAFAVVFTLGAGGVGGIFAPSLFMGAALGFSFAYLMPLLGLPVLNTTNFALVGMGGLIAGVLHAPLTAIFMIAEITGGYDIFLPLMLVAAISFLVTRSIEPHSIYTQLLAKRGDLLTHNKDQAVLTLLELDKVLENNFSKIHPDMPLGELVEVVSTSRRNLFPVLDQEENLVGVLTLDDFRHLMFDQSLYATIYVRELMSPPPALIQEGDDMRSVMQKFQETDAWNLPVVKGRRYRGFVSKSKLFSAYRRKLLEFS